MKILNFFKHKMYFTVSLSDASASKTYSPQVGRMVMYVIAVVGSFMAYDVSKQESSAKNNVTAKAPFNGDTGLYEKQISLLDKENKSYNRQVKVYAQELAVLQARLDKFDNITKRLLDDSRFADDVQQAYEGGVDTKGLYDENFSILDFEKQFAETKYNSEQLDQSMNSIVELLGKAAKVDVQTSFNWPVINKRAYISSKYGWRTDPFTGNKRWHSGIDIGAGWNAPIVAVGEGVVIHSGYRYGYGISVELQHKNGITTRYAHMNKAIIKKGDVVKKDDLLGLMGSSGRSTGPHLHFEVLVDGKKTDPTPYVDHDRFNARRKAREGLIRKSTEKS
ncbi:MAG: M23 family metallopeptidase [Proteobacteria bacterium]|nr:M23 family metallopeptidase [Pseudomonadota bacterium]